MNHSVTTCFFQSVKLIALLTLCINATGCTLFTNWATGIADDMVGPNSERVLYLPSAPSGEEVSIRNTKIQPYRIDDKSLFKIDNPQEEFRVQKAIDVLNDPLFTRFQDAWMGTNSRDYVASANNNGPPMPLEYTRSELDVLARKIEDAHQLDAWAAAQQASARVGKTDESRAFYFIAQYFRAYFRSGEFVQISIDLENEFQRLIDELKKLDPDLDDGEAEKLAIAWLKRLHPGIPDDLSKPWTILGKIGDGGLILRDGTKLQFPAINVTFSPSGDEPVEFTDLNYKVIVADAIRVLLEATFDASMGFEIPASDQATAIGFEEKTYRLKPYDPKVHTAITAEEFQLIGDTAKKIESTAIGITGRFVRGIAIFSLDNEYLAVSFETLIGVTVKKLSERIVYDIVSQESLSPASVENFSLMNKREAVQIRFQLGGRAEPQSETTLSASSTDTPSRRLRSSRSTN